MNISLSAFAPENLVSRDGFGSPVPRQPAHLHTQAEWCLRDSSRVPRRRPFIYLNRHTPSSQSRVYRVTQDYFCLLEFECQDLRRNTATMGCTAVHFLPISLYHNVSYRAFVGRWDTGVVLGLVVYPMYRSKPMSG